MKRLYITDGLTPYKVILTDEILHDVKCAMTWLQTAPWYGNLWILVDAVNPHDKGDAITCKLFIGKDGVTLTHNDELMIDEDDDILELPDHYVSKQFDIKLPDFMSTLELDDVVSVSIWRSWKEKTLSSA